jgi:hypothetical protein
MKALPLLCAAALAGCYGDIDKSDPRYAEMEGHHAWMQQLKAEDPDTGSLLAELCYEEVGAWFTSEKLLELSRCMRRKYDEGIRWVPDGEA